MTIIDSIVRLIPGVLGGAQSAVIESFSDGETLEFPQYTRPEVFRDLEVPAVLLSGNHAEIAKWRAENSLKAK
jgi:tRNA (guanine37-N1)-methyltransferase